MYIYIRFDFLLFCQLILHCREWRYVLNFFLQVKEQSICTLWNLSVDEKLREKIANNDLLPLLIKSLDEEDVKVKEAAGGVLENLALSRFTHNMMVEAGVIPKLVSCISSIISNI